MIHVLPDEVEHCQVTAQPLTLQRAGKETHGGKTWAPGFQLGFFEL